MTEIERLFQRTEEGMAGSCPLQEPGRGAPPILIPNNMRIEQQPAGYDYDSQDNQADNTRFSTDLHELARTNPDVARWLEENDI